MRQKKRLKFGGSGEILGIGYRRFYGGKMKNLA
nr:MAG TPA: hypothetical protein [Caudoviricetes sp.]